MSAKNDFVIIKHNKERDITAEYFAIQKLLLKNPSHVNNPYADDYIDKIKFPFLSEFAVMEYLCSILNKRYSKGGYSWDISKIDLADNYFLLAGVYDETGNKTIKEKTIDIMTGSEKVTSEKVNDQKIKIDRVQFPKANIYIQTFILKNNDILLSGFLNNIRGVNDILSNPYITLSPTELNPMKQLIDEFEP